MVHSDQENGGSRVALVTGANRGIGREITEQLAQLGVTVVIGSRDIESGRAAADAIIQTGGSATNIAIDVADETSVETAIDGILERFGRIDILVNNAGIAIDGPEHRASQPDYSKVKRTLETNLFGTWNCSQQVLPSMVRQGYGRIVNVSTTMASLSNLNDPASPAYRISKVSVNMLTALLAAEFDGGEILINCMSPGYTKTDMSPNATRTVAEAADTAVWLATLPNGADTGGFYYEREPLDW